MKKNICIVFGARGWYRVAIPRTAVFVSGASITSEGYVTFEASPDYLSGPYRFASRRVFVGDQQPDENFRSAGNVLIEGKMVEVWVQMSD